MPLEDRGRKEEQIAEKRQRREEQVAVEKQRMLEDRQRRGAGCIGEGADAGVDHPGRC